MKKIFTVGFLSFLGGSFFVFLIVYLVLIPAGIFPFGTPTTSPGGYPLPGNLCVYNTSTSTVEVWLNGVPQFTVGPTGEINFGSTGNISPGEYRLSLKPEGDYRFIDLGLIEVKVDRETWVVVRPDLSAKIKYTRWLPMNEFPPRAFLESDS